MDDYEEYDLTNLHNLSTDYKLPDLSGPVVPEMHTNQIVALVLYGLVFLLGVPGNAVVVWVTGFCMPRSVTVLWFLNLALADLLCCLSLPLLMVPLAHDDHWPFGPLACTLVKSLLYMLMFCSVLQLVVISVDRVMLVTIPVWCQNHRRPKQAACVCAGVWALALVGSIPQFVYTGEYKIGEDKRECLTQFTSVSGWLVTSYRFIVGFAIPFLVIVVCHLVVYRRATGGLSGSRTHTSKRTLRVIVSVVLSFFLCWFPLHVVDFITLTSRRSSALYLAQVLTLCLAYFNSCLNPPLYVCLGKGFKDSMNKSLGNILNFISEDPTPRVRASISLDTKSTTNTRDVSGNTRV